MTTMGTCRLTGDHGKFVKSHLIPLAFSKRENPRLHFMESRGTERPIKRSTSWYDRQLVTAKGEEILAYLDDYAAKAFASEGLRLRSNVPRRHLEGYDLLEIRNHDWRRLRLFGLSLLWRCAASTQSAVEDIALAAEDLECLRDRLISNDPGNAVDFPILMSTLSGNPGNLGSPTPHRVWLRGSPFARFWLDGVSMLVSMTRSASEFSSKPDQLIVGVGPALFVPTIPFEDSAYYKNAMNTFVTIYETWGDPWDRNLGPLFDLGIDPENPA